MLEERGDKTGIVREAIAGFVGSVRRRLLSGGRPPRWLALLAGLLLVGAVAALAVVPFLIDVDKEAVRPFGYPGIFLVNVLGTGTVFVPVPGLSLIGQILIVEGPRDFGLHPVGVVALGSLGMTVGEITGYITGRFGRRVSEAEQISVRGGIGERLRRVGRFVDRLMARYGVATLFVLSAIPNPIFEIAGVTAGAVRMSIWRFLAAVGMGKTVRVIMLVMIGDAFLDLLD